MSLMAAHDRTAANQRTQFRDIVAERKEALGLGYQRLAARCVDPESGEQVVKASWLHRVVTGEPVKPPSYEMLRGMEAGLGVSMAVLQDATSAEFFGAEKVFSESADRTFPTNSRQDHWP